MTAIDRRLAPPLLAALLVLVSLRPAFAAEATTEEVDYARTGPYLGVGMVYAAPVFDLDGPQSRLGQATVSDSPAFGLDARGGYRFHPHFAAEGDFQWVSGFEIDQQHRDVADVDTWAFTANGKAYAMTDTLQPYFVGGVGVLHVKSDEVVDASLPGSTTGFVGRVGAGADYYFRPNIVLNVEFSAFLPTGHVDDFRYLPLVVGAQYRF